MTDFRSCRVWLVALFVAPALVVPGFADDVIQQAGCKCAASAGGQAFAMPIPQQLGFAQTAPAIAGSCAAPGGAGLYGPSTIPQPPDAGPPPGTLGRTYYLPSRPLPASKHPRIGMLDICAPGVEELVLVDTNEYREEDYVDGYRDAVNPALWHFETDPLIPGLPHIYRVEARCGGVTTDVRYVRLIRGRILEVNF